MSATFIANSLELANFNYLNLKDLKKNLKTIFPLKQFAMKHHKLQTMPLVDHYDVLPLYKHFGFSFIFGMSF